MIPVTEPWKKFVVTCLALALGALRCRARGARFPVKALGNPSALEFDSALPNELMAELLLASNLTPIHLARFALGLRLNNSRHDQPQSEDRCYPSKPRLHGTSH